MSTITSKIHEKHLDLIAESEKAEILIKDVRSASMLCTAAFSDHKEAQAAAVSLKKAAASLISLHSKISTELKKYE